MIEGPSAPGRPRRPEATEANGRTVGGCQSQASWGSIFSKCARPRRVTSRRSVSAGVRGSWWTGRLWLERRVPASDGELRGSLAGAISEMGPRARLGRRACGAGQIAACADVASPPGRRHFPGGRVLGWGSGASPRPSSLPCLGWQKPGQVAPGWHAVPCLCTFCRVGGAGRRPGYRLESGIRAHASPGWRERISDAGVNRGWVSWAAEVRRGQRSRSHGRVAGRARARATGSSGKARGEERAGGFSRFPPPGTGGGLGAQEVSRDLARSRSWADGVPGPCYRGAPYLKWS